MFQRNEIMAILKEHLSVESKSILLTLKLAETPLRKEVLWEKTNENLQKVDESDRKLLSSRYVLDIHTARLEGAGLVDVEVMGRIRVYSISDFGLDFLNFIK
ncbi:hypothetical protein [Rummeliibacillus stabekisii]|uniref:hypothetical protein n=1 Tax=Rummeliibacillus stabekisii TaxID=241244 RepID=UPI00116E444C|nr:hypothetical protein [Rummeliibacillus stabekisii]MBB5171579.1 DNA-binding transcriptional ArsR family regulator [Rummeliibacillus stabekisii]GEL05547.1 hypothetical protein RST01_21740 [Rummeliibacillus stabekisii]